MAYTGHVPLFISNERASLPVRHFDTHASSGGSFTWPSASNTGPTGTLSTNNSSSYTASNGETIQNQNFTNVAMIVPNGANNVTIQNCLINMNGFWGIDASNGGLNTRIINCRFTSTTGPAAAILSGTNGVTLVQNCDISGSEDGIKVDVGMVVDFCYIHDLHTTASSHNDSCQLQGYNNVTIKNCWLETPDTSCIILGGGETRTPGHDILVQNNHFQGGGYCFYGPGPVGSNITDPNTGQPFADPNNHSYNVQVLGNYWSTVVHPNGGLYGSNTQWETGLAGNPNVWGSDNVWADGASAGQYVAPSA